MKYKKKKKKNIKNPTKDKIVKKKNKSCKELLTY